MANSKIRGITIELSADASGVNDALKEVNSALKRTQSDLRDVEKLLKLDPSNTELLAQKQDLLSKALNETKDKVDVLKKAEEDLAKQMVDGGTEEQQRQMAALQREIISTEADMRKYEGQLKEVSETTEEASGKTTNFGEVAKKAGEVAVTAMAAVAAATAAVIKGLGDMIADTAEYGDEVDKMSQKLGLSTDAYQEWDYVLSLAGTEMSSMSTGLKTLTNKLDDAKNGSASALAMFESLGLSLEDLQGMSREDAFEAVIYGFQDMADSTERAALANDLFGKSGQELAPLFNQSREETEAQIKAAREYGMVMSEDAVKASAEFQDSLTTMNRTMDGFKRNLVSGFLPSVSTAMDGFTEIMAGNTEEGIALIEEATDQMVQQLNDNLPTLIEVGGKVIVNLLTGIVQSLPELIPAIVQVVLEIVDVLLENLPMIIEAAVQIIIAIIKGIAEALPDLIPKIVEVVLTIVDTLIDNIDLLIEAAIQLMIGLAIGLVKAIPEIVKKAPEIISSLFEALIEGVGEMISAGWELIKGLWEGIKQGAEWLWNKVKGWLDDLWGGIKDFFGIASPSKEMEWVGKMLTEGLTEGIEDNAITAVRAAEDMASGILNTIKGIDGTTVGLNATMAGATGGGEVNDYSTTNNDIVVNVYGAEGQDVNLLADEVIDKIQRTIVRSEAVYA